MRGKEQYGSDQVVERKYGCIEYYQGQRKHLVTSGHLRVEKNSRESKMEYSTMGKTFAAGVER